MRGHFKHSMISGLAVACALAAQPAMAQGTPSQSDAPADSASVFGDIVVTARKVQEASQSLPIAIAAFSGKELTNKVVLNVRDLQAVTPGLTVSTNSQGGAPIFAIRGTATENGIDGGVALYLNDVALVSSIGLVNQFFDVAAVEILKGPQGTQFGTNTTGGTITVRSNEPTKRVEAFLKGSYGNYNRTEVEGMVNLPVNDALQVRLAGQWIKRDGHINNPEAAGIIPKKFGNEDHYALRGSVLLDTGPVKSLTVVDYYHENNGQLVQVPIAFRPSPTPVPGVFVNLDLLGQKLGDRTTVHIGPNVLGSPATDRDIHVRGTIWGVENRTNIQVSDNLSIRNVAGYRDDFTDPSENYSGTTLIQINVQTQTKTSQWSDDLTFQYHSTDNRLRLSVGGYWQSRQKKITTIANAAQATFVTFGLGGLNANIHNFADYNNNTKALYANGEFEVTPTLTAFAGIRYNWDSSKLRYSSSQGVGLTDVSVNGLPTAAVPCNPNALKGFPSVDLASCFGSNSGKWKAPSWEVSLTQHFSPKVLAYAKVSHGYLAGGLNNSLREVLSYNPETKTEYEAGVKADYTLMGRPVRTNLAVYLAKTKNKQVIQNANYDDGGSAIGVLNAAKETAYGLDLETRFSPVDGLTLEANYNYIHIKFDDFKFPALGGNGDGLTGLRLVPAADLTGAPPAQTPKHQLNLAATWELPVPASAGKVSATMSAYYTSEIVQLNVFSAYNAQTVNGIPGTVYNVNPSYWVANASLNWGNILGSPVSGQFWVRNLFDRTYITFQNPQFNAFGYSTAIYGLPRTYGVSASVKF